MPKTKKPAAVPDPIDPETYAPQIETALHAFSSDVSYAVLVARSAVNLARKRKIVTHEFARA